MKKLILAICILVCTNTVNAQWNALGAGLNGHVRAITVFNGQIYAGGNIAANHHIAVWNGSAWSTVGGGFNDTICALVVHSNKLYAAGNFTADMGGRQLSRIAVYNTTTSQWDSVGSGLNNFVRALYSDGTYLYAGGAFNGGSAALSRIAKFNGTAWSQVGDAPTSVVNTITKYNGTIYIGGGFSGFAAKLNGSTWQSLSGINFEVICMEVFGSRLYLGGKFTSPSGYIASYDGTSTGSAFNTLNNYAHALYATPNKLFCGGAFTQSPSTGTPLQHFFSYNGSSPFASVGTGFDGDVYAISNLTGKIVVGGNFTSASGTAASNIAISASTIDVEEHSSIVVEKKFFPNPAISEATLQLITKESLKNPVLKVMDCSGKLVDQVEANPFSGHNSYSFHLDLEGLASGIYYYTLSDDDARFITADKFVVR